MSDTYILPPQKTTTYDSQNVAFWSQSEQCYVCYFRTWKKVGKTNYRWISRSTSEDFVTWSVPVEMKLRAIGSPKMGSQSSSSELVIAT